jgi:hypothetical protein
VDAALIPPKPRPKPVEAEAVEEERPRKKLSRRDEDDEDEPPRKKKRRYDDDDYEHDHPRKQRRSRRSSGGGSGGMVVMLILGGVLLLVGLGVGIYFLTGKGGPLAKKAPLPEGWKEYSYPQDGFKAAFPTAPSVATNQNNPMRGGGGGMGGFPGTVDLREMESASLYTTGTFGVNKDQVNIAVIVARFRNGVPRQLRDQIKQMTNAKMGNMESRQVRWLGTDAAELVMGNMLMRIVYTDNAMIAVQIAGPNGTRARPEEEAAFFDHFELTD